MSGNAAYPNPTVYPNQPPPPQQYNAAYPNPTVSPNQPPPPQQYNAAYPNPTNQPPPQPYPGYPPTAPAYDPTKQPMGQGVPAG